MKKPTWTDVKRKLEGFERRELLGLVQDLYAAHKDNRALLHTRFGLGEDVLDPYKKTIARWIWPDVLRGQSTSVAKAKQAISEYKKALGDPAGMAELMVFYCEQAVGFYNEIALDDDDYLGAFLRMFEQAMLTANKLSESSREPLIARLQRACIICDKFGYGVGKEINSIFSRYTDLT